MERWKPFKSTTAAGSNLSCSGHHIFTLTIYCIRSLRETNDEMVSNLYFTPDLTKCQSAEAFKLREERHYRKNELYESTLKISRAVL